MKWSTTTARYTHLIFRWPVRNHGLALCLFLTNAVSELDEIVPASVVFDFEHPDFSPTNRVFREQTPPSPFTPGARFRRPPPAAEKSKRPREPEVIDLTMDEDDEDVREVVSLLHAKPEPRDVELRISPRKKVRYS